MSHCHDFLFELGIEELPPTSLLSLADSLLEQMQSQLSTAQLSYTRIKHFATPRRLAIFVEGLDATQPTQHIEKRGPAIHAPEKAVAGFAKSCGVSVDDLLQQEENNGTYYIFKHSQPGKTAQQLLPVIIEQCLNQLPIKKRMRWGSSRLEFVRPVKWVLALLDSHVLPCEILGVQAGANTFGHRFHAPEPQLISSPASYVQVLQDAHVIADFATRQQLIIDQVQRLAHSIHAQVDFDKDLLDEITALVEWPVALMGQFDEAFLQVPQEALISSMRSHQKYFHLTNSDGTLLPYFITVSNIDSKDPSQVIAGNEKVIRPRLADAAFFFKQDQLSSLESRSEQLQSIVFQSQLGSLHDKVQRVAVLSKHIASLLNTSEANAERAARLSKCDLLTQMVFEFPELQGLMGKTYAERDGELPEVALALKEQYLPRFAGDILPQSDPGICLALADKIDTITGLFAILQPPTGSKDPYAIRRQSLGVLRILIELKLDVDLRDLITTASQAFVDFAEYETLVERTSRFMLERLRAWYEDQNIPATFFIAVNALQVTNPLDFDRRVHALHHFTSLSASADLSMSNKRVANILAKQNFTVSTSNSINTSLLIEDDERHLYQAISAIQTDVTTLCNSGLYIEALNLLCTLHTSINAFFDSVMVLTDDADLQRNRLLLLHQIRSLFLMIADISLL